MVNDLDGKTRPVNQYVAAMAEGIGEASISVEFSRHAVQRISVFPLQNER